MTPNERELLLTPKFNVNTLEIVNWEEADNWAMQHQAYWKAMTVRVRQAGASEQVRLRALCMMLLERSIQAEENLKEYLQNNSLGAIERGKVI